MRLIVLNEQMEESIEKIEAVISDLVRNSEDLSDIVAAQDKEISRIKDSLQWLLEREFERQNAENTATDENFHHIGRYESNCHSIEAKVGFTKK